MTRTVLAGFLLACLLPSSPRAEGLNLPPRPPDAKKGSEIARSIAELLPRSRELAILAEVKAGNVPNFLRTFVPVTVKTGSIKATFEVAPDYLALGSDDDYFLVPLTPYTAQQVADLLDCTLPTPRMVDDIYAAATIKLDPSPISPSPAMTTVPVFLQHNQSIQARRKGTKPGPLVAGHKKDVVIANKVFASPGKVAIYGWHRSIGKPIQPLYTGHTAAWVDYSHGIRLIHRRMLVNDRPMRVEEVLADLRLAPLLSDEGVMKQTRYEIAEFPILKRN